MADREIRTSVSDANGAQYATKLFRELSSGVYAETVALGALDGEVTLTGDLVVDTLGALNNAKVVNPDAASATIPALLRGALAQQVALVAAVATEATLASLLDINGALDDSKEIDPDAVSATLPALSRGQLAQLLTTVTRLTAMATAIGTAGDAAGDNTVIGQLKQIAENTTPS